MATSEMDDPVYVWARRHPFTAKHGLGRTAMAGLGVGAVAGAHIVLLAASLVAPYPRLRAWALYAVCLCCFHTLEFVSTARGRS